MKIRTLLTVLLPLSLCACVTSKPKAGADFRIDDVDFTPDQQASPDAELVPPPKDVTPQDTMQDLFAGVDECEHDSDCRVLVINYCGYCAVFYSKDNEAEAKAIEKDWQQSVSCDSQTPCDKLPQTSRCVQGRCRP